MITNATIQSAAPVADDIRDIKPPLAIPNGWEWLWWALFALAATVILFVLWQRWQKRKADKPVPPPIPAHVRAKQKLADALALISQPKPFVIAVSDTARTYLEERFDFHAPERTTEEFLRELSGTDLLVKEQKESLGNFLASCDLVKFAKYEPGETELRGLHSSAIQMVEETKPLETERQIGISPQGAHVSSALPTANSKGKNLATAGAFLQLAPLTIGIAGIVYVYRIYHELFNSLSSNTVDKSQFTAHLQMILMDYLWLVLICFLLWLAGLVLLVISLVPLRYRARWFFWFLIVYGIMMIGAFPLGTLFGAFVLIYCPTKRKEFLNLS